MTAVIIVARVLMAPVFVISGYRAFREPGGRVAKAAALGIPFPEFATRANGVLMVIAGLTLAVGLRPRESAAVLFLSLIPTTLAGHPFWKERTSEGRLQQQTQFLKNLSLLGGLLAVVGMGG